MKWRKRNLPDRPTTRGPTQLAIPPARDSSQARGPRGGAAQMANGPRRGKPARAVNKQEHPRRTRHLQRALRYYFASQPLYTSTLLLHLLHREEVPGHPEHAPARRRGTGRQRRPPRPSSSKNKGPILTYVRTQTPGRRHKRRDVAASTNHDGGQPARTATPFR